MKKNLRVFVLFSVTGLISLLQACQKDDLFNSSLNSAEFSKPELKVNSVSTFYSPTLPIGNGVARAWVSENKNGEPVGVGLNFTEKSLKNLPSTPAQYVFSLPANKGKNFYTHVLLDWNPQGHEPPHVYDLPHFDIHFYIIPNDERMAIGPDDNSKFDNLPYAKYVPPYYIRIPGGVPQMGVHWVDFRSPEFNGGVFTKTFIWGSYNGKFIFWEPMITLDYLLTRPDDLVTLDQPSAYQTDGYYATKFKVSYSSTPKEYTVALTDLVYQKGE